MAQRQAHSMLSRGPCSRLQGRGAGHSSTRMSASLHTPCLPCPVHYSRSFALSNLANIFWQLPSTFLMRLFSSLQPVPRELLALSQDAHLREKWLPWCAALECHCAASIVLTPSALSLLTAISEEKSIHPIIILLGAGGWGLTDGSRCFIISPCKFSSINKFYKSP